MKYEMMKVFDCSDMPDNVRKEFFENSYVGNDCYIGRDVYASTLVDDEGNTIESEEHTIVDAWLLENGATDGEYVIVKHSW